MQREKGIGRIRGITAWTGIFLAAVLALMNTGLFTEPAKELVRGEIGFEEMTGEIAAGYRSDRLWHKNDLISLNGLFARLTLQREYNQVLRLNNGMLTYGQDPLGGAQKLPWADQVGAFSAFLEGLGIPYLFVQLPVKMDAGKTLLPAGKAYTALEKTDLWVRALEEEGVRVLDLRPALAGSAAAVEAYFYRTDHHWNADGAFEGFRRIMEEIRQCLRDRAAVDTSLADRALWQRNSLEHWLLGSHGKRVGTLYAGTDPLIWYTPLFPTEMSCILPKYSRIHRGDYSAANLRPRYLEKKDYFNDNAYCVTIGGDYPLVQHRNAGAPNQMRILLLKDSFCLPLQAFLSTEFAMVDVIDPRHYTESSIAEYCLWTKPDLVLTAVNPSSLSEGRHFEFGTASTARERECCRAERIEADAAPCILPVEIEPGKTYRFSFEGIALTGQDPAGAGVALYDFDRQQILLQRIFDTAFSAQGMDASWTFRAPAEAGEKALGLLIYPGLPGSAGGPLPAYQGIRVSVLE